MPARPRSISRDGDRHSLLLHDAHLLFVHTTAMHLELGQSSVDLFQVFRGQYELGGFDVLLKMLDLARSGDRNDERLLGQQPCERQLRGRSAFPSGKLGDAIDKRLIRRNAFRLEAVEVERRSDFGSNVVCASSFCVR